MTSRELRAELARLGLSLSDFARRLQAAGDTRPWQSILSTINGFAAHNRTLPVPWWVPVMLRLIEQADRRSQTTNEEKRT